MPLSERLNSPISDAELERRWRAVRTAMEIADIDVLIAQANNDFMGGYVKWLSDLPATQGYFSTVVFPLYAGMTLIGQGGFDHDVMLPPGGDGGGRRRGPSRSRRVLDIDMRMRVAGVRKPVQDRGASVQRAISARPAGDGVGR